MPNFRKLFSKALLLFYMTISLSCANMDPLYHLTGETVINRTFHPDDKSQESWDYDLMIFKQRDSMETYPLILLLHGSGMAESGYSLDWESDAAKHRYMIAAPIRTKRVEADDPRLDQYFSLVERLADEYPIERNKIYIAGLSSGALIARWMIVKRPDFFNAAIFIASETYEDWVNQKPITQIPPTLFVHGAHDEQFDVNVIYKRVSDLRNLGFKTDLIVFEEGLHEHREEWNQQIFDWLKNVETK